MHFPSQLKHERRADAVVHVLGVFGALIAGASLVTFAAMQLDISVTLACVLYALTMLASKLASAFYHLLPHNHWRPLLRRLDHAAIYALIAGTFTPLLVFIGSTWSLVILAGVWALAVPAMLFKMLATEIEPRWSLYSYLGLGWIGALAMPEFHSSLPASASIAAIAGGLIYTAGTFFYARKEQSFRYAVWHSFVVAGTGAFFTAIWLTAFSPPPIA